MARPHKKAGAGVSVQTSLPVNQLQTICRDTAETCARMGSKIQVIAQSPSGMELQTSNMIGMMQNRFRVNFVDRGDRRGASTELTEYKTHQQTIMFIPVMPKQLAGLALYKSFIAQFAASVQKADGSAEVTIRDR